MANTNPNTGAMSLEEIAKRNKSRLLAEMVSIGFYDAAKSSRWLNSPELEDIDREALFSGLRYAPSPDIALPAIVLSLIHI